MKHDSYNEQRERGNFSFPVEYHYVTNHHPRYNMPYHWHIQYEIIRVLEGKIVISIDENEYTASPGDIILSSCQSCETKKNKKIQNFFVF